jgi:hypothetical protein
MTRGAGTECTVEKGTLGNASSWTADRLRLP